MSDLLEKLTICVERGKVNNASPYPPDLKGQDGADELTATAIEQGLSPDDILQKALVVGMSNIGKKFSEGKAFVPEMLMAARAMKAAMVHIDPYFKSGKVQQKGTFIVGTIQGDLHDIGKSIIEELMIIKLWIPYVELYLDTFTEALIISIFSIIIISLIGWTIKQFSFSNIVNESSKKHFFFALICVFCGNFIFELANNVKHNLFKLYRH